MQKATFCVLFGLHLGLLGACEPLITIEPGEGEGEGEGEGPCDVDGDGVDCSVDCDDNDPDIGSNEDDFDCDGVPANIDCNDFDPTVSVSTDDDADCDGVNVADDCNDRDPFVGARADDADCDGFVTADDCDDNDPNSTSRFDDADCDGVRNFEDCDDSDPDVGSNFNDNDCDGVPSFEDCNDFDPSVGRNDLDADCDGFDDATELACGSDPQLNFSIPSDLDGDGICDGLDDDADGDGVDADEDCDDLDAAVYPGAVEVDFDGKDNNCDGDFGRDLVVDAALTTGGEYRQIAASQTRLFLSRGDAVDAYDRATLALLGSITLPAVSSLAVVDDHLYVVARSRIAFVSEIHVVDPLSLQVLGSTVAASTDTIESNGRLLDAFCTAIYSVDQDGRVDGRREVLEGGARACAAIGDRVVAVVDDGVVIVGVDGAVSPPVALPATDGFTRTVVSDGAIAYVVLQDSVSSFDVTGAAPVLLDTLSTVQGIAVGGEGATLLSDESLLIYGSFLHALSFFVNVADPSALELSSTDRHINSSARVRGTSAFFFDRGAISEMTLSLTGISDEALLPGVVSRGVTGLLLADGAAHLISQGSFISFTEQRQFSALGGRFAGPTTLNIMLNQSSTLDTTAPAMFDAVFDAVAIVDVSSGAPVVTRLDDGAFGFFVGGAVSGTSAVTAVRFADDTDISTWDLSTPSPTLLGSVAEQQPVHGLALVGDVLHIINGNNRIVAHPDRTPTALGAAVDIPTIGTPAVIRGRDNVLYHATQEGFFGARVVDDVNAPGPVAGDVICEFPSALTLTADRAYVGGFDCLSMLSLEDPQAPAHIVDAPVRTNVAVAVDGDLVRVITDGAAVFLRDTTR